MASLDVEHFLGIYKQRKSMQDRGLTNPKEEYKIITNTIVEKLSKMPLDEKVELKNNQMIDSNGNVIVTFPR